jgi:hypothetical protein
MPQNHAKDPQAVLDYPIDWESWLEGDTIATSTWTADAGITIESDTNTATTTTVWLSGGTLDAIYSLTNHIVTAAGREDDRTIQVRIGEK